ncbi:hypothetical protein QTO34_007181 [Cnephaeus nilssonii]|uniref:MARVEL domain-containing protein n=1 Tax=Cnephaeus nilssonii TaxID=3371016 RepID=A0AA40HJS6_CNENI|nr:hypothetical protein QTO34_007181 [Eptesicus nilssonii]
MSHGAGLVRTTCSSGGAAGPRAGAGPPGTSASEGLVDPVYPRTHGALLKVAQMVAGDIGGARSKDEDKDLENGFSVRPSQKQAQGIARPSSFPGELPEAAAQFPDGTSLWVMAASDVAVSRPETVVEVPAGGAVWAQLQKGPSCQAQNVLRGLRRIPSGLRAGKRGVSGQCSLCCSEYCTQMKAPLILISTLCGGSVIIPIIKVSLLIAFICVRSSPWISQSAYRYFEVVTMCNLIMILAFYLVHLFRLYRVLTCISWPLSELLHYLIGTLLLLIASIVAASKSYSQSELVAASVRISSGRLRRESVLSKLVSFLTGTAEGLFSGALLSQNRYPPWSSQPGLQRGLHGGSREVNHQGCWHTNRPSGPGLSLAPATQIGWHVDLKSRVRGGHVLVAASAPCRDIVWSLVGPREQHCDLLIFGFVATFLCLASVWLSYKISCVTQSTARADALTTEHTALGCLPAPVSEGSTCTLSGLAVELETRGESRGDVSSIVEHVMPKKCR